LRRIAVKVFFLGAWRYNLRVMKDFLSKLVQAETTAEKGELAGANVISAEFGLSGIDCLVDSWDRTRANAWAAIRSERAKPGLLFACHLDGVGPGETPWRIPPFAGVQSNGRIHGSRATDMKGGIEAIITAIRQIVDSGRKLVGDILFVAAAGEETDSCGANRFIRNRGDLGEFAGVVIPEPTNFEIVTAHRGIFWLEVATRGKATHSSTPELGVNAIASMKNVLNELESYEIPAQPHELLGGCSMSINTITGGKAPNVVPDKCTIGIDIRTLPGQNSDDIIDGLKEIFAKLKAANPQFEAEVSVVRKVEPLETDCSSPFVKNFCAAVGISKTKAVGFTTDGPHFASLGAPVVIFGPGKPELCHKPDEYIDLSDVEKAVDYYKRIILNFLT